MTSEMSDVEKVAACPLCKSYVGGYMKDVLKHCTHCGGIDGWHKESCARLVEKREAWIDAAFDLGSRHGRPPAPAAGELAALAEAWVKAEIGLKSMWMPDNKAHQRVDATRAAFHTALSAHLAEVRAAIGPVWSVIEKLERMRSSTDATRSAFREAAGKISDALKPLAALAKKLEG